jgi:hypothetical protein
MTQLFFKSKIKNIGSLGLVLNLFLVAACATSTNVNENSMDRFPASAICGIDPTNEMELKSTIQAVLKQRISKFSKSNFKYEIDANRMEISGWELAGTDMMAKFAEHVVSKKGDVYFRRFKTIISTPDGMLPYLIVDGFVKVRRSGSFNTPEIAIRLDKINSEDMRDINGSCQSNQMACLITNQVFGDRLLIPKCPIGSLDNIEF